MDNGPSTPSNKSQPQSPEDRLWTARHEAGHAVLIGSHCSRVEWVSVDQAQIMDPSLGGQVMVQPGPRPELLRGDLHRARTGNYLGDPRAVAIMRAKKVERIADVEWSVDVESACALAGPAVDFIREGGPEDADQVGFLGDCLDDYDRAPPDIVEAMAYIAVLEEDQVRRYDMLSIRFEETVRLIHGPRMWPIIVDLADLLAAKGTIHHAEFYEFLEGAACPNPFQQRKPSGHR